MFFPDAQTVGYFNQTFRIDPMHLMVILLFNKEGKQPERENLLALETAYILIQLNKLKISLKFYLLNNN